MPADRLASGSGARRQGRRPPPPESAVTRRRAGDPSRRGRAAGPDGPFVLAPGLTGPGALPVAEAAELVVAELVRQAAAGVIGKDSAYGAGVCARQFAAYAGARGVALLGDIDQDVVEMFLHSPHVRGPGGAPEAAALGTRHFRRSAARLLFKTCRVLGLDDRDPAADIVLPPRHGSVEHVAARLGLVSLDAAAHVLGLDWRGLYDLDGPPGVARPSAPGTPDLR